MNDRWVMRDDGTVSNVLQKAAADAVTRYADFGDLPELAAGAVVASCTAAVSPSGPTAGVPAVLSGGYLVSVALSGGTAGTDYAITFAATLDSGKVISRAATLKVV